MTENRRAPLASLMHPSWAEQMEPVAEQIHQMGDFVRAEQAAGKHIVPEGSRALRAFSQPLEDVRVLVVGQDPYPTPGNAVGLSFSVERDVTPVPKSLQNIYAELEADLGHPPVPHGDLTTWFEQGVLLLNRVLTTVAGQPAAHQGKGWEEITAHAIDVLCARPGEHRQPLVAILWGRQAQSLRPQLAAAQIPVIESAHPSPLAAYRGFFGSKPFSRANQLLADQGVPPIDWRLL